MWIYIGLTVVSLFILKRLLHIPWVSGIHNKCVFITGCDSGFGNALAKRLYNKGVFVFAGCFTEKGAKRLGDETGERLKTVIIDVSQTENIQKAYDFIRNNLPANSVLWGVVNNAGIPGRGGPIEFIERKDLMDAMNINCFGAVEVTRIFLPLIKKSKGRIVNISSIAGKLETPLLHPYVLSKFALSAFSEALRYEKSIWGIKVATVCPGVFLTNIMSDDGPQINPVNEQWNRTDPEIKEEYGENYLHDYQTMMLENLNKRAQTDLSPVLNADEHALFARNPHAVYYPGTDAVCARYLYDWIPVGYQYIMRSLVNSCIPKILK